jgi:hypothetical protein
MEGFPIVLILNLRIQVNKFLVELQTLSQELSWSLGQIQVSCPSFINNLKIPRRNSIEIQAIVLL